MTTAHRQRGEKRGYRYLGTEGFTPDETPKVPARSVACPTCKAGVNEPCHNIDDPAKTHDEAHRHRKRLATREYNARQGTEDRVDRAYVRDVPVLERRRIRKAAGLSQQRLADKLDVTVHRLRDLENGVTQPTTEWSARYGAWLRKQKQMVEASTFTEALAGEIRARMGRRSMNGLALAEATGLSNSSLARKLKGETPFNTAELELIAARLDTSIQALVLSVRVPA